MKNLQIGEQIQTTVIAISGECVFIDLNAKSEGIIDANEFTSSDGKINIKEGDKICVYYLGDKNGEMRFTTKFGANTLGAGKSNKASGQQEIELLEKAYKNAIPVEGKIESEIKGGFAVKIGTQTAFCPYSQIAYRQKEDASFYIGKTLSFKIQEFSENARRLVLSRRVIEEEAYQAQKLEMQKKLSVGMIVNATVESLQSFGAFVNLQIDENGADNSTCRALLPISELKHGRVTDASSVVSVGDNLRVKIISIDFDKEKIAVSLKAMQKDPWDDVATKYAVGTKITGKISRVADFGVFVTLQEGVDGLVHISKFDELDRNTNLRKVFAPGTELSVVVQKVDANDKRISLALASKKTDEEIPSEYLDDDDTNDTYNPFANLLKK